ncbi:response regulator [Halosolutus gelatinilyticus]|uniref:response regulator n=1 Tax=Halosolutus gelatinilyticus TaxID=2931975 RepID=UPI001FF38D47|nr:response regulator [Halosolutus gelatinilyticus]
MAAHQVADPSDILLVEDNPGDVRLTKEAFKEAKIANTLHVVCDGAEALDFLHRRGDYSDAPRPAIVLLDFNLPRTNGDEVLDEVNEDPELRSIPVVMLTGSESETDIVKSHCLGANAYLTKPVDPLQFIETVIQLEEFWLSIGRAPESGT